MPMQDAERELPRKIVDGVLDYSIVASAGKTGVEVRAVLSVLRKLLVEENK